MGQECSLQGSAIGEAVGSMPSCTSLSQALCWRLFVSSLECGLCYNGGQCCTEVVGLTIKGLKIIQSVFWVPWGTKVLLGKVNNTKWNPKRVTLEFLINNLNVSRASADKKKYALHRFHCNGFPRYFFILSLIENKLFWMMQRTIMFLWVDRP